MNLEEQLINYVKLNLNELNELIDFDVNTESRKNRSLKYNDNSNGNNDGVDAVGHRLVHFNDHSTISCFCSI
jgi:hypothetical protein